MSAAVRSSEDQASNSRKRKRDEDVGSRPLSRSGGVDQTSTTQVGARNGTPIDKPATLGYASDASIILIGMAGAGKRTLAVMGALATHRRCVYFNDYFQKHTGSAPSQYIEKHGIEQFRQMDLEVTRQLFADCSTNCIIGGLSGNETHHHARLLRDIASTNPVIYVRRDVQDLRQFVSSSDAKFADWYHNRDNFYRSCSTFDFYNLKADHPRGRNVQETLTLKLKSLETDFVRFVRRIFNLPDKLMYSVNPLSAAYTYALTARSTWLESNFDYEELECGADVINLVVDLPPDTADLQNRLARQIAMLRRHSRAPIILEPCHLSKSPSSYLPTLKLGSRNLCDMIAVNHRADISACKEFISLHPLLKVMAYIEHEMPWDRFFSDPEWSRAQTDAAELNCAAIRLSQSSISQVDNIESVALIRKAAQKCRVPLIAYNANPSGQMSICLNQILSPVVPHSFQAEGVTIKQAQIALHSCFVLPKKEYRLFGQSVSYSLSPAMHTAAYEKLGLPHRYSYVETSNFEDIHEVFQAKDLAGVAVTLPYKSRVLGMLDHVSEEARQIGAVNTVLVERRNESGANSKNLVLRGHNTDHIGLRECICRNISPANSIRPNSSVLIIGAGGMARAALYACRELGVKQGCVWNRTVENAETLVKATSWSSMELVVLRNEQDSWPAHLSQPTIVISTIPAHRLDQRPAHELNIPSNWLQSRTGGVFMELAYKPIITRFISQMQTLSSSGWVVVDGLDVLLEQGIAQFELFTGRPAPVHTMRHTLREQYTRVSTPQKGTVEATRDFGRS